MADISSKYYLQRNQGHILLLGSKTEEKCHSALPKISQSLD